MNKTKFFVLAALGLALTIAALKLEGTALARHPASELTFYYQRARTIDPGQVWTDRNGLHIRNRVDFGLITGGISGAAYVVYNADLKPNLLTTTDSSTFRGDGFAYGKIQIFSSELDLVSPTWKGDWTYQIVLGKVVSGALNATSSDGRATLVVRQVSESRSGAIRHTGFIDHLFCPTISCPPPPDS